jgi:molybdopterin synthase sulfur carrier subunit
MVKVQFFASFREAIGIKETTLQARSVEELVKKLIKQYKPLAPLLIESTKPLKIKPYNMILINGCSIWLLKGLCTVLKETDVVSIFPPVGGG